MWVTALMICIRWDISEFWSLCWSLFYFVQSQKLCFLFLHLSDLWSISEFFFLFHMVCSPTILLAGCCFPLVVFNGDALHFHRLYYKMASRSVWLFVLVQIPPLFKMLWQSTEWLNLARKVCKKQKNACWRANAVLLYWRNK